MIAPNGANYWTLEAIGYDTGLTITELFHWLILVTKIRILGRGDFHIQL